MKSGKAAAVDGVIAMVLMFEETETPIPLLTQLLLISGITKKRLQLARLD